MLEFDQMARFKCPRCKDNDSHLGLEIATNRVLPPPEQRLHVAGTVPLVRLHHLELAGGKRLALWEKAVVHILSCGVNEPLGLRTESLKKTHGDLWDIVGDNRAGSVLEGFEALGRESGPVREFDGGRIVEVVGDDWRTSESFWHSGRWDHVHSLAEKAESVRW